jgi:CRP/FNR family transcriptional regulator
MLLLGRKTARERVASFIAALARRRKLAPGAPLELPMSRADIADYLGLTIETVSRTLTLFRKEGLIELPDKHLVEIRRSSELDLVAGS